MVKREEKMPGKFTVVSMGFPVMVSDAESSEVREGKLMEVKLAFPTTLRLKESIVRTGTVTVVRRLFRYRPRVAVVAVDRFGRRMEARFEFSVKVNVREFTKVTGNETAARADWAREMEKVVMFGKDVGRVSWVIGVSAVAMLRVWRVRNPGTRRVVIIGERVMVSSTKFTALETVVAQDNFDSTGFESAVIITVLIAEMTISSRLALEE